MSLGRRRMLLLVGATCALALLAPSPLLAQATDTSNTVISDCLAHPSGLSGRYTVGELRLALEVMPAETSEYTSCPDVINSALLAAIRSGGNIGAGTGSGPGSFLPTPVIAVLVLLGLGATAFGAITIRRR